MSLEIEVHFLSNTSFNNDVGCVDVFRYSSKLMADSSVKAAYVFSNLYFFRYSIMAKLMSSFYFEVKALVYLNLGLSIISVISFLAFILFVVQDCLWSFVWVC